MDSDIVLSDDLLDILETELEECEEENNLSTKISKHVKLTDEVEKLIGLVNGFIKTIEEIDDNEIELIDDDIEDIGDGNIGDILDDISKELDGLNVDENIKKKIEDYRRISIKIRNAKNKVEDSAVNIKKIN